MCIYGHATRTARRVLLLTLVLRLVFLMPLQAQESKLVAGDGSAGDEFGNAVAISGDYVIVGVRQDDDAGDSSGSAYVFVREGTTWTQQAKLTAGDAALRDRFGTSVAISGDYAIVGATDDDDAGEGSGSAYVFVREGSAWTRQAKLTAGDAATNDRFGGAVAVSSDYAIVSATGDDDDFGSAYVFIREGLTWTQQAKLVADDLATIGDAFGNAVAISGNSVVVGSFRDDEVLDRTGSAYVFVREGTTWTQQVELNGSGDTFQDEFGTSVAITGDVVVAGAPLDDPGGESSGSAYVFVREGTTWTQQAKLTATDAAAGDEFGTSVAVSDDYIVVSAPGNNNAGAAYVFARSDGRWFQQAKLTAGDTAEDDEFGTAVALSGRFAVVTARLDDDRGNRSGSAYVFAVAAPATPTAPQLIAPGDGAVDVPSDLPLSWQAVDGAATYRLHVSSTSDFSAKVVDEPALTGTSFQVDNLASNATYYWRMAATNPAGTGGWSDVWRFTVATGVGVEQVGDAVPAAYSMSQNYPNPFNPTTTVQFAIPSASRVTLKVYDASGIAVATLVDGYLAAGRYTTTWHAAGFASGVYMLQMHADDFVQTKKVMVVK